MSRQGKQSNIDVSMEDECSEWTVNRVDSGNKTFRDKGMVDECGQ